MIASSVKWLPSLIRLIIYSTTDSALNGSALLSPTTFRGSSIRNWDSSSSTKRTHPVSGCGARPSVGFGQAKRSSRSFGAMWIRTGSGSTGYPPTRGGFSVSTRPLGSTTRIEFRSVFFGAAYDSAAKEPSSLRFAADQKRRRAPRNCTQMTRM